MKNLLTIIFLAHCVVAAAGIPARAEGAEARPPAAVQGGNIVTVRPKNAPLRQLFAEVSSQTQVGFTLEDPALADLKVTIFARNMKLESLLELLSKYKDLEFHQAAGTGQYTVKRAAARAVFPPLTRKDLEEPLYQRVIKKVRLQEAPFTFYLDVLTAQSGINFLAADDAAGLKITTSMNNATVADTLLFLKSRGFEYSRVAGTKTIVIRAGADGATPLSEAEAAFGAKK